MRIKQVKKMRAVLVVLLLLSIYPSFVLGYTWFYVAKSNLLGGRGGPLDAYRHTLASAIVAYTLDEKVVELVTVLMESNGAESNLMDVHNNKIGSQIGANSKRFYEIEGLVLNSILRGQENSKDPNKSTWLPKNKWQQSLLW